VTGDDFAARLCARLVRDGEILEDGRPHRLLFAAAREEFEAARREERAAWEREREPVAPGLPVRVGALPSRE
jgi:hypothetical protein